jgi:YD repeat-containing protein
VYALYSYGTAVPSLQPRSARLSFAVPGSASQCPACGAPLEAKPIAWTPVKLIITIAMGSIGMASLLAAAIVAGAVGFMSARITETGAYKDALAIAGSSPEVQSALGTGIQARWPVLGSNIRYPHSQFAQWSVALHGSRGGGHLYGVANQSNGSWEFSRLSFVADKGHKKIHLGTKPRPLNMHAAALQHVFLIPMGLSETENLDWAPDYYKAKLGIDAVVLPAAAWDATLEDPHRHQLDANKCIEFLQRSYPDLARDPFAILIGVTSRDMYIPDFTWAYAENWRTDDRFAIVSSARLRPIPPLGDRNPEWLNSRLQKLLTKNIALLYFGLPMSSDYTSLLSGGVLSGWQIDNMGGEVIGPDGVWSSFLNSGDPGFSVYDVPGKPALYKTDYLNRPIRDTGAQLFSTDLSLGLLVQRKMDFMFDGESPLLFSRVYTSGDERSRSFGVGATNSLDIFLVGQMGSYVDLCLEDGARIHFIHRHGQAGQPDAYVEPTGWSGPYAGAKAELHANVWQLERTDGWTLYFAYHPEWLPQNVTVLGSSTDPAGHEYKIERDSFGDLVSVTTPSGNWLRFRNDAEHRIQSVTSSLGRTMQYEYDSGGRLVRASDSEGRVDSYSYDGKSEMLTAGHRKGSAVVTNAYSNDGYIKSQTLADGGKFEFSYFRGPRNVIHESQITDPRGMLTSFLFGPGGYSQTLPRLSAH